MISWHWWWTSFLLASVLAYGWGFGAAGACFSVSSGARVTCFGASEDAGCEFGLSGALSWILALVFLLT